MMLTVRSVILTPHVSELSAFTGAAVQAEDVNLDEEEVSDAEDKPEPEQPKRKKKRAK